MRALYNNLLPFAKPKGQIHLWAFQGWRARRGSGIITGAMIKVFVFIDALGWKQVERYGFLRDLLPNRRKIEMQFGYSCTAIPTMKNNAANI